MERKRVGKKFGLFIVVIVVAAAILAGLLVGSYPHSPLYSPSSYTFSEWVTEKFAYGGVSSVGAFIEVTNDHGFNGFVVTGTAANGSLLVVHTRPTINGDPWWQKTYGNGSANGIAAAEDDGFIVAGVGYVETSGSPKNVSLLLRIDSGGNLQWSKTYDGNGFDAVVNASDGGFVVLGRFNVNGTELPGLMKVDSGGNVLWTKIYTSSEADVLKLYTLIPTADGGYGLVGEMQYTIYGVVMRNGWFVKTNANGDTQVNRPFSMNGACVLRSVVQLDDGGYVLAGATADSSGGVYSACLLRTDYDGHMLWSRINATLGTAGDGRGFEYYSAIKAENGTLFVTGYLSGVGSTVEAINATGETDHYEFEPIVSDVNHIISASTDGYALAGYKNGTMWVMENYFRTVSVVAVPSTN